MVLGLLCRVRDAAADLRGILHVGHFYWVERDEQIPAYIEMEVGEALEVTVRGARLRFGPASALKAAPIAPYPTRLEGQEWVIALGDLVSLQELTIPVRISFAREALAGSEGSSVPLSAAVSGVEITAAEAGLAWTIAPAGQVSDQPRNRKVDRVVAEAYAALARREAGALNRDRDFAGAQRRLEQMAARIKAYAGSDDVLNDLVRRLARDAEAHFEPMRASDRKQRYMGTSAALMQREMSGSSKRAGSRSPSDGGTGGA